MDEFNSLKTDINALTLLFPPQLYMPAVASDVGASVTQSSPASADALHITGKNNLGVVFIYAAHQPVDGLAARLFQDIITKGIRLGADDYALVRLTPGASVDVAQLHINRPLSKLVLWGVDAGEVGMQSTALYQVLTHEQITVLAAEPLEVIASDTSRKKQLWTALQQMFS